MTQLETPAGALDQPKHETYADFRNRSRSAVTRIVQAAIEATAEAADLERTAAKRQRLDLPFLECPAIADPQPIRDFVKSEQYQDLSRRYVAGEIAGHLLTHVLRLSEQPEFDLGLVPVAIVSYPMPPNPNQEARADASAAGQLASDREAIPKINP